MRRRWAWPLLLAFAACSRPLGHPLDPFPDAGPDALVSDGPAVDGVAVDGMSAISDVASAPDLSAPDGAADLTVSAPDGSCPEVAVAAPLTDGPAPPLPDAGPPDRCRLACPLDCLNALTNGCEPAGNVVYGDTNAHVRTIRYANGVQVEQGGPFMNPMAPGTWIFGTRVSKDGRLCYQMWQPSAVDPNHYSYLAPDGREVATAESYGIRTEARCLDEVSGIGDTACPLLEGPPNCAPGPAPAPDPNWCRH